MRHLKLKFGADWRVVRGTARSQAAVMTLRPGEREGGPDSRHRRGDQWLFVVEGAGTAVVEGKTVRLGKGSLLLIERGERHEVRAEGRRALKTLNFYAPPEY